jgi:hypothetical protein
MFKQEARIQKDFNKFLAGLYPNVTKSPCECMMSVRTYHKIEKKNTHTHTKVSGFFLFFVGLGYQGKDIVFRFIIEYSSLRDFGP